MSNIYIQEPPTCGKVILKTSVGDIEIELWAKEAPLASRNFVQLCMEKYYNNTIFHRVVRDFIIQGGDPTGTGEGGESIYGQPFKDEFHTRLRFCRRGLVAMANAGKDDNGSQFFFTLGATQELQNKHTIFGKVAGDTIYNMLKLGEGLVDENERPLYPHKITNTEVLNNPFDNIVPRSIHKSKDEQKDIKKKEKTAAVKNFKLLSFGEEAEEDEEETIAANKKFVGKGKSAHDTLADPKLSSQTAIDIENSTNQTKEDDEMIEKSKREISERIKSKLMDKKNKTQIENEKKSEEVASDDDDNYYLGKSRDEENKKKLEEIKKDIRSLKKEVRNEKKEKEVQKEKEERKEEKKKQLSDIQKEYYESQAKFREAQRKIPKKDKDAYAAKMLEQFKNKLNAARSATLDEETEPKEPTDDKEDDDSWMTHTFQSNDNGPVLAKDASTKDDDWFEIYDPRNPINKRRRGETTDKSKKFKK